VTNRVSIPSPSWRFIYSTGQTPCIAIQTAHSQEPGCYRLLRIDQISFTPLIKGRILFHEHTLKRIHQLQTDCRDFTTNYQFKSVRSCIARKSIGPNFLLFLSFSSFLDLVSQYNEIVLPEKSRNSDTVTNSIFPLQLNSTRVSARKITQCNALLHCRTYLLNRLVFVSSTTIPSAWSACCHI